MKVLYVDCFSGVAGDMLLGALIDAGVPLSDVRGALGSLAIDADTVWTERVTRAGLAATKFCVRGQDTPSHHEHDHHQHDHSHAHGHSHGHDHGHHHAEPHGHRTLAEISRLIDGSALSPTGRDRALALFRRLGEAEAAVHGTSFDQVHLHEVGALDSIIDIVGSVHALERLGVDRVVSSPLNVGSGSITSAHGTYPVPAPATLRLLRDAPVYAGSQQAELVTPTGALLVTDYATSFGPMPAMRVAEIGYGAGSRDFADTPNVTRVVIGETGDLAPADRVLVVEAEIDDMNPQLFGGLIESLLAQGALDAFYTPIYMKKGRPGTLVTVIAPPSAREAVAAALFRDTTTIGIRYREADRECLSRETIVVPTAAGEIRVKVARRAGQLVNAAPEFDDCVRAAAATNRPVKEIHALAVTAFYDRFSH
ncbi:MAG TPA: nickel pincer cofactor biosynthesis protein LarC [Vicinamibacterales bacterium]